MRQGQTDYGQAEAASGSNNSERLNNLKRAIDALEQRLAHSSAPASTRSMPEPTHPPHYDGIAQFDASPSAFPAANDLGMLQNRLAQLATQISQPSFTVEADAPTRGSGTSAKSSNDDIASAAAEIMMRQQALSNSAAPTFDADLLASIQENNDKTVETVTKQLSLLKRELSGLKKQVTKPVSVQPKVAQAEIDRIAKAINDLQKGSKSYDETAFKKLGKDLDSLRNGFKADVEGVKNDVKRAVRRELGASNGNQTTEITTKLQKDLAERMAALTQDVSAASTEQASAMMPRVDHITSQVDALKTSVDGLPEALSIDRLEHGLRDMTGKMEALVAEQSNFSSAAKNALSSDDLSAIESRLDEVSRSLVAVSNLTEKASAPDLSGVDRVEARMAELARAIDVIGAKDTGVDTINELAVRIEGLTERLGSFEKYAESGDLGGATQLFAAPDIGVLEDQIRQMSDRLDSNLQTSSANQQTGNLEAQIAQLTTRFEETAAMNSTAAQMSNLEAQVGQIIRNMNKMQPSGDGSPINFEPMEQRLAEIESYIANGQNISMEAAQQAAQHAVSMMGAQSEPGQIISALSEDLKTLQAAAENGSQQSIETTERVQQTLSQVVDRLNSIENAIGEAADAQAHLPQSTRAQLAASATAAVGGTTSGINYPVEDPNQQLDAIQEAAQKAGLIPAHRLEADEPLHVNAPSLDPTAALEAQIQSPAVADTPVEPSNEEYNVDEMVAAARNNLGDMSVGTGDGALGGARPTDELRPDAVAAARRALQATTAEMSAVKDEALAQSGDAKDKKSKRSLKAPSLNASKLRKPLIMGAAALVLAIVAFKGVGMLSGGGGGDVPVAKVETQTITPQVVGDDSKNISTADKISTDTVDGGASRVVGLPADQEAKSIVAAGEATKSTDENAQADEASVSNPNDAMAALTQKVTAQSANVPANVPQAGFETPKPNSAEPITQEVAAPTEKSTTEVAIAQPTEPAPISDVTQAFEVPSSAGSKELVSAAQSGDEKALFQVGMRYSEGNGVQRNLTESAKWFERSAERGFAPAQYSIGSLYEKGIGVERDVMKAAGWYEKAATQGNARAMHNLAVIYAMGNPPAVQPQMEKAVGWFQKAADFGIKDSQFNLGILYGQGMGVPQNLTNSFKWFALAAKTGDADASAKRDEVANAMEPTELAGARKVVNDWAPKRLVEAANRVAVPKEWQGNGKTRSAKAKSSTSSGGSRLKQAQALLNKRGFDVGTPDGLMGPKTKRAIMEFQRSAGIPVTGRVDSKLLAALDLQT